MKNSTVQAHQQELEIKMTDREKYIISKALQQEKMLIAEKIRRTNNNKRIILLSNRIDELSNMQEKLK